MRTNRHTSTGRSRAGWVLAVLMLLSLLIAPLAHAQGVQDEVAFAVQPRFPENQIADNGFFHLRMQPGQRQTLTMTVHNRSDQPIAVTAEAFTATTNGNGVIEYGPAETNAALPFDFAQAVTVDTPELVIPANGSEDAIFTITMPEESFAGEIAGAFLITKKPEENDASAGFAAIRNIYAYAVGVRLRETDQTPMPSFSLQGITPVDAHTLQIDLVNDETLFVRYFSLMVRVYEKGNETPMFERTADLLSLSPNSMMPYRLAMGEEALPAGPYEAEIILQYQDQDWTWREPFDITE